MVTGNLTYYWALCTAVQKRPSECAKGITKSGLFRVHGHKYHVVSKSGVLHQICSPQNNSWQGPCMGAMCSIAPRRGCWNGLPRFPITTLHCSTFWGWDQTGIELGLGGSGFDPSLRPFLHQWWESVGVGHVLRGQQAHTDLWPGPIHGMPDAMRHDPPSNGR